MKASILLKFGLKTISEHGTGPSVGPKVIITLGPVPEYIYLFEFYNTFYHRIVQIPRHVDPPQNCENILLFLCFRFFIIGLAW